MPYNQQAKVKLTNMTLSERAALNAAEELLYSHTLYHCLAGMEHDFISIP